MSESFSYSPFNEALTFHCIGLIATVLITIYWRIANGLTLSDMLRNRFFELPPIRAAIWTVWLAIWAAFLVSVALLVKSIYQVTQQGLVGAQLTLAVSTLVIAIVALVVQRTMFRRVLDVSQIKPPEISVGLAHIEHGIPRNELKTLGSERFPNVIHPQWRVDIRIRILVVALVVALVAFALFVWYDSSERVTNTDWLAPIESWNRLVRAIPLGVGIFMTSVGGVLLISLLGSNYDYALFKFRPALLMSVLFAVVIIHGAAAAGSNAPQTLGISCALALSIAWRALHDVKIARHYRLGVNAIPS